MKEFKDRDELRDFLLESYTWERMEDLTPGNMATGGPYSGFRLICKSFGFKVEVDAYSREIMNRKACIAAFDGFMDSLIKHWNYKKSLLYEIHIK